MKNIKSTIGLLCLGSILLTSCDDFTEINTDPKAASIDQVQVEYFLNGSIVDAQQDPHIAERAFILYWKTAGRQHRSNGLSLGTYNDGWSSDYYGGSYLSKWLNSANMAIETANRQIDNGSAKAYTKNSLQASRIWRAYLMSEFTDNFGPMPINGFQGQTPEYSDVKTVYYYMLQELKEAASEIDPTITAPTNVKNLDPSYAYDYAKWQKFANSLRMRLAMRLSEVDEAKAKAEFEDAIKGGNIIKSADEFFQVQELGGWSALTGVMSREWNAQQISATLNNLYVGLGGIPTSEQVTGLDAKVKPADYMGVRYADHFTTKTNDPSAGYWFDGLHSVIDPRAYKTFNIPGQTQMPEFSNYPTYTTDATTTKRNLVDADGKVVKEIEANGTWNAFALGQWGDKGAQNFVYTYIGTNPRIAQKFRNGTQKRIFFASWETYFLLAEAAVRGWNAGIDGQAAYEAGIKSSFDYNGVSQHLSAYLASESYSRTGTSVSWNHTTEPTSKTVTYVDGYTNTPGTTTYNYPKNELYKNGTVRNDLLTKIISQKFIAQTPWLPLETWSDHRRLGLPFFENPAVEIPLVDNPNLTQANYMTVSNKFFPQRLRYPSTLATSNADGYNKAVQLLGGADNVFTPLWWAKK